MSKKNRRDKKKPRKPLTPEQLAANRQNAQHSTGPTSEEGKEISSRNATTHGAWSEEKLLMPWESQDMFDDFYLAIEADYNPRSAAESLALDDYIWACWRVRRLRAHEVRLMTTVEDPARLNHELFKLSQTEMRIRRIRDKALAQFHEVRKQRRLARRQEMHDFMNAPLPSEKAAAGTDNTGYRQQREAIKQWLAEAAALTGLSPEEISGSFRADPSALNETHPANGSHAAAPPSMGTQNTASPPPETGH